MVLIEDVLHTSGRKAFDRPTIIICRLVNSLDESIERPSESRGHLCIRLVHGHFVLLRILIAHAIKLLTGRIARLRHSIVRFSGQENLWLTTLPSTDGLFHLTVNCREIC